MRRPGVPLKPYIPDPYERKARGHTVLNGTHSARPIYKSRQVCINGGYIAHQHDYFTGTDQSQSGIMQPFSGANTFSGSTNPFWRDQIRNGQDATTAASGTLHDYLQPWLSSEVRWVPGSGGDLYAEWYGYAPVLTFGFPSSPTADQISRTEDRAKRKFLNKLDSILSSVELGQDLGEYRETIHGITSPLKSMRNLTLGYLSKVGNLKRSFKNPRQGLLGAVADTYLEFTFGWNPLASDIADAYVGLRERANRFVNVPISAGAKLDYGVVANPPGLFGSDPFSGLNLWWATSTQASYTVRYKGLVKRSLTNGAIPAATVLQLDLPHFVPTVWDLIPYSFIVDYFTNVGDIIRAYTAVTHNVSWCCKTTRTVYKSDAFVYHTLGSSSGGVGAKVTSQRLDGQHSKYTKTDFTRESVNPSTAFRPAFHFSLPTSDKPWVNIAAILTSRIAHLVPLFR